MQNKLTVDVLKVCFILNKHSVKYLIVGGTAVALYGFFRMSTDPSGIIIHRPDLDFWYSPTYENYYNLLSALKDLNIDTTAFMEEKAPDPKKSFFRKEFENFTLDFLPEVPGLKKFSSCYGQRQAILIDDVEISVIGYEDLIKNKMATGRKKDIDDIDQLESGRGGK